MKKARSKMSEKSEAQPTYGSPELEQLILDRLARQAQPAGPAKIGDRVRASMDGVNWFTGTFVEESDIFATYGVLRDDINEVRFFLEAVVLQDRCTDERMCAACYSGQGLCESTAPATAAAQPAAPRAFEYQNPRTGRAILSYDDNADLRLLIAEKGYVKEPLYTRPAVPLSDERMCEAMRKAADDLLDHIYEFSTISEGTGSRLLAVGRDIEAAHKIGGSE
jgi:hypothetical protein